MEASHVDRLIALFERTLEVPQARRAEFLNEVCGNDTALRDELTSLLGAHESATDYFDSLEKDLITPATAAALGAAHRAAGAALLAQLQAALGDAYRIRQELGGGMSRVFLAEEVELGRKVVVKVLPPEMAASGDRFRREIQLAAQLQHPHIVPLLTSHSAGSFLYYTMPFVAGESLRARLARDGALPVQDARRIWRDVLDALAHAHASGVIHRDIKPGNILLSGRSALVSDFGIARAIEAAGPEASETAPGLTIGTPGYMAPEQVTGDRDADHRVDLYAAGLVMYEMLEGRLPFSGDSAREVILARLTQDPSPVARPDCPPELTRLVMHCLAKAPAARPQTAEALLAELEMVRSTSEPAKTLVRPRPRRRRRALAYGSAALAVAAVSLGTRAWMNGRAAKEAPAAFAATARPLIAVMPLRNLSADSSGVALADGMTEDLISMLSRAGDLRVIPGTSVSALKGRGLDVPQIAESLHVSHFIEGSLQTDSQRLRVQVRLITARDHSTRWSETYDRAMRDIFAVQDDIDRGVSREVGVRLAGGDRGESTMRRYTPSIAAYESYRNALNVNLERTAAGREQAKQYFMQAIAADSGFAPAYARLAALYVRESAGDHQGRTRAETAALKAIALDDSLADAHAALGWARSARYDWAGAEAELKRAIALDPRAYRGFEGLARIYMAMGRSAEQLAAARSGLEIEPYSTSAIREFALALVANGRCDEAIERLAPLKDLNPPAVVAGVIRGQCYAAKQMWPQAITEFRWASDHRDGNGQVAPAFLGYAFARAGQTDSAKAILSDLLEGRQSSLGPFGVATVYLGFRDYDKAFLWLDKAIQENSMRVYLMGPMFEDLRKDARFARVKKRMGL